MSVKIHAIKTGSVQIKTAQRIRKPGGPVRIFTDSNWTEWLPIYSWIIEHPEGIIAVDTGETSMSSDPAYYPRWHPYFRGSLRMNVKPGEEAGTQLESMGIKKEDVKILILTHFHTDHAGGLHHFPKSKILVSGKDLNIASGFLGKLKGYLPHRWPKWFMPNPIAFEQKDYGPFSQTYTVTKRGDIVIVPTPGHTPGHMSVIVNIEDVSYFLAGDTSYTEKLLLDRKPDGVSPNAAVAVNTMEKIISLSKSRPLVYMPTHDPMSTERLKTCSILNEPESNILIKAYS